MTPLRRLLLAALCALPGMTAPLLAQSSVWKVTRDGATVYLGGTCHVLRSDDFPLPAEFDVAYAASSRLYFETDVARMLTDEMEKVIATQGMFTDGRTLASILTPGVWQAVQAYGRKAGLSAGQLRRTRPWLLIITMAALEMQKLGVTSEGVDFHYYHRATRTRKPTGELESFEDHIAFLTGLGAGREDEMVSKTLADLDEIPAKMTGLLAAWRTGDVARIDELMLQDMRTEHPAIFETLLVARNNAWLPRIEALFETPEVEFVLVGVGHMPGPEGLLAGLRARGCLIEQIPAPPAGRRKSPRG
jgi:uncharacterized protein YbaP (TraB family)